MRMEKEMSKIDIMLDDLGKGINRFDATWKRIDRESCTEVFVQIFDILREMRRGGGKDEMKHEKGYYTLYRVDYDDDLIELDLGNAREASPQEIVDKAKQLLKDDVNGCAFDYGKKKGLEEAQERIDELERQLKSQGEQTYG